MKHQGWITLAILSVKKPAEAARILIAMGFASGALWNALMLVAVGNTLLFALSDQILDGPSPLPGVLNAPLVYFSVVAGGLALTALSVYWIGRWMGGMGTLADILVLITWMQMLRLLVQVVVLALVFVAPLLSAILVLAAGLVGVYMLVHFVNQAHRFNSSGKAILVLVVSLLAIVVGLSIILTLVGGPFVGTLQIV